MYLREIACELPFDMFYKFLCIEYTCNENKTNQSAYCLFISKILLFMHNISVGILKFYIEMSILTWSGHLIQLPKYGPLDARQDSTPFLHEPLPLIRPLYQGCIIKHIQLNKDISNIDTLNIMNMSN